MNRKGSRREKELRRKAKFERKKSEEKKENYEEKVNYDGKGTTGTRKREHEEKGRKREQRR